MKHPSRLKVGTVTYLISSTGCFYDGNPKLLTKHNHMYIVSRPHSPSNFMGSIQFDTGKQNEDVQEQEH